MCFLSFKRADDILPLMLALLGIIILYPLDLYQSYEPNFLHHDILNGFIPYQIFISDYLGIFSKILMVMLLCSFLSLYHQYFYDLNIIISAVIMGFIVYIMAIQTKIMPIPDITKFILVLASLKLWELCFWADNNWITKLFATIITIIITMIDPFYMLSFFGGILITTFVTRTIFASKEGFFYFIIILMLIAFTVGSFILIYYNMIIDFQSYFIKNYQFGLVASMIASFITLLKLSHISNILSDFMSEKLKITSYAVMVFIGSIIIGRLDYVANFNNSIG